MFLKTMKIAKNELCKGKTGFLEKIGLCRPVWDGQPGPERKSLSEAVFETYVRLLTKVVKSKGFPSKNGVFLDLKIGSPEDEKSDKMTPKKASV